MTKIEIEEMLPSPIKIVINCYEEDMDSLYYYGYFSDVLTEHNKGREEKIDSINVLCVDGLEEPYVFDPNYYEIYVGEDNVLSGILPSKDCYGDLTKLMDFVLSVYHDDIIKAQDIHQKKLEEFEFENYDELLYFYYRNRDDTRYFYFLKRLAEKYPHSSYDRTLRRIYRSGLDGVHEKSMAMERKLFGKHRGFKKDFHK